MTADLVLTDRGHVIAATDVPAYLAHPANSGRVVRVTPLLPKGHDGGTIARLPGVAAGHMKEDR